MKIYRGSRSRDGCLVTVNNRELPLRLDLRNHSPTGFQWGYQGSGPAQLALAILADVLGDEEAHACYQAFKREVIALLSDDHWQISSAEVSDWHQQYLDRASREG